MEATGRRHFLKGLSVASAGTALVGALAVSGEKVKAGGEEARAEIERLKQRYEQLDRRTQMLMRAVMVLAGVDVLLML